jgi:SulP family sulfate permease
MKIQEIHPRLDIIAGLITAAIVIPKAMAYATIAGLPVQVGLYTALVPMLIYAFTGTSRTLSVSTTTTMAILVATVLNQVAPEASPERLIQISSTLALLVGVVLILASFLRLGFIANFISEPVLVGFKAGIGIVIIVDQIPKLLGLHLSKGPFLPNLVSLFQALPATSILSLVIGLSVMATLIAIEYYKPTIPAPLVVVALGIAASSIFKFKEQGVALVGSIPQSLPTFIIPDASLANQLWPAALGIALMSFTETIAAGRAFKRKNASPILPNQELLATGLANIGGGLMGAMTAGGGTSQTAVNLKSGAQSQLAQVATAFTTAMTILLLAPFIALMPQPALAAIVIVYSVGLIHRQEMRDIRTVRLTEFIWAVTALLGVILLGTMKGIVIAIVVSLIALAQQTVDAPVRILRRKRGTNVFRPFSDEHPDDESFAGLLILKVEGRVFFLNAAKIGERIRAFVEQEKPQVIALDLSAVPDLEYTALKMLMEGEQDMRDLGIEVWLVGLNPNVWNVIQRSSLFTTLGRERTHFSLELAVSKHLARQGEFKWKKESESNP